MGIFASPLSLYDFDERGRMRQTTSRITTLGADILAAGVMSFAPDAAWGVNATLGGGNTAWILAATALVLLITLSRLAQFYGGLV